MNRPIGPDAAHQASALAPEPEARGIAVNVRRVDKGFSSGIVLRHLDLQVPGGQFLAVVGRSGCGKSTLLRLLSGLDQPSAGSIVLGDPARPQAQQAAARLMFQEPRLLPWASVLANVEIGLGAERARPGAKDRASEALRYVGLEARAEAWPSSLSGGQKQRVALARALVSRPRLLALDEPLGALDALTRIEMQRLVERVWLDERFTAVLVTHDVAEALTLADRVVLIEAGAIALDLPVALPRPRRRGSIELARLEETILARLLGDEPAAAAPTAPAVRQRA